MDSPLPTPADFAMASLAARLHVHAGPVAVETVMVGDPGPGEVRVELEYGGVNPVDRYIAAGSVGADERLPRILGGEAAGRLDGRSVLVTGSGLGTTRDGVWAGHAIVPATAIFFLPAGVGTMEAAAMGIAGLTAWNCVHTLAKVTPEDRVLVLGAAGGVGSMIVSLVHALGATVWGQTGSDGKADLIAEHGADRVIVSPSGPLGAAVLELEPTVVFDPLGGQFLAPAVTALAPRGRIISFGTSAGANVSFNLQSLYRKGGQILGYGGMTLTPEERRAGLEEALMALARGDLKVTIDEVLPLEAVNRAFERLEQRLVVGKLLLDLRS